ncbi:hypothetical protein F441_18016 [Phytophthora nicotianae CJ01A1]|uniref:Uncharacterized protein n=1 Tax=Phytophthora nicotianae CJ01A1 TaxID=1317063 RepID=W2W475_PHYNI|nr:hypothetical protein F441_18016 [Phytophthora nicotianae CJ01A1]
MTLHLLLCHCRDPLLWTCQFLQWTRSRLLRLPLPTLNRPTATGWDLGVSPRTRLAIAKLTS